MAAKKKSTTPDTPDTPGYFVAAGKSVSSLKGVKVGGDEVSPDCFQGGEKTLQYFIELKCVVRK